MSVHNSNLKCDAKISVHSGFRRRKASMASPGYTGMCYGLVSDRETREKTCCNNCTHTVTIETQKKENDVHGLWKRVSCLCIVLLKVTTA